MTIALIEWANRWLNLFPAHDGVSADDSPAAIVVGSPRLDVTHITLTFGAYVQVYDGTTNTLKPRAIPAIALRPSNEHGGYYFLSLETGRRIHCFQWQELLIPDHIVRCVEQLATSQKQPDLGADGCPIFELHPGQSLPALADDAGIEERVLPPDPVGLPKDDDAFPSDHTASPPSDSEYGPDPLEAATAIPPTLFHLSEYDYQVNRYPHDGVFYDSDSTDDAALQLPYAGLNDNNATALLHPNTHPDLHTDSSYAQTIENNETNIGEEPRSAAPNVEEPRSAIQDNEQNTSTQHNTEGNTTEPEHTKEPMSATSDDEERRSSITTNEAQSEPVPIPNHEPEQAPMEVDNPTTIHIPTPSQPRYNLRKNRTRQYNRRVQFFQKKMQKKARQIQFFQRTKKSTRRENMRNIIRELHGRLIHLMFTQMTATRGIRKHGKRAVEVLLKEYIQLKDLKVMKKIKNSTLTIEQKQKALRMINLIKEKRCGRLKGRACADGRAQRGHVPKEETAPPTLGHETLIASLLIDVFEGRSVGIFDVPGAYLHAFYPKDKFVLMKLEGQFVDMMCEADPSYINEVHCENGKKVIYVQLVKALYGCVESVLLWYELYSTTLQKMGFEINPYDKCIANKMINGKLVML